MELLKLRRFFCVSVYITMLVCYGGCSLLMSICVRGLCLFVCLIVCLFVSFFLSSCFGVAHQDDTWKTIQMGQ